VKINKRELAVLHAADNPPAGVSTVGDYILKNYVLISEGCLYASNGASIWRAKLEDANNFEACLGVEALKAAAKTMSKKEKATLTWDGEECSIKTDKATFACEISSPTRYPAARGLMETVSEKPLEAVTKVTVALSELENACKILRQANTKRKSDLGPTKIEIRKGGYVLISCGNVEGLIAALVKTGVRP